MADRTSSQLVEGRDFERLGGEFRLLKKFTIPCPLPVPTEFHAAQGTCSWKAEQEHDQTEEPLFCRLECSPAEGWPVHLPSRYNWDGSSAPWLVRKILRIGRNTEKTLRATLHHDAMYEGLRAKAVPPEPPEWTDRRRSQARKWADRAMHRILVNDGYSKWKGKTVYFFVRWLGSSASKPKAP